MCTFLVSRECLSFVLVFGSTVYSESNRVAGMILRQFYRYRFLSISDSFFYVKHVMLNVKPISPFVLLLIWIMLISSPSIVTAYKILIKADPDLIHVIMKISLVEFL